MNAKEPSRWESLGVGLAVGGLIGLLVKDLGLSSVVSYWGAIAPWIVAAALITAAFWRTRLRGIFGWSAACLGILWLIVSFTPLTLWMARDLPRHDPLEAADAVFVLGSRMQTDGELTTEAMSRMLHGLELIAQGHAPRLIVSELLPPFPSYADATRGLMQRLGITGEVLAVGPIRNTHEEAVAVGELFRERGWEKLLLVTAPTHSRRAGATFESEGMEVISSPSVQTRFDLERLDFLDDRTMAFRSLIHEWVGARVYRFRGWMD
jgi:uncharacterized SAM-binding protein YcdF (DUF218 family)